MLPCRSLIVFLVVFHFSTFSLTAQHSHDTYCANLNNALKKKQLKNARVQSLQDNYDVKFYFLDIEADNLSSFIKAKVSMKAQVVSETLDEIQIGLSNAHLVDSVFINDTKMPFVHANNLITFATNAQLLIDDLFTTTVYYHGDGGGTSFFSGISNRSASTGDRVTYTLSEPENAIDWFACKQVLEDKADSAYINVTVPSNLTVGSNGLLSNIMDLPENRRRFEWKTRYPIAYYLISMSIAEYDEYTTFATVDGKSMPILNYVYKSPGLLDSYKPLLDETASMIELYSELYGPYPFSDEKYGHAMAPLGGGMEHQTMSTMDGFNYTLIAHELAHQWFGDNVTCGSWQDIWLNEGFARYSEYLVLEKLQTKSIAHTFMAEVHNDALNARQGSVFVPADFAHDVNRIFNWTLTYNRGGSIIHMIRYIINDDVVFFDILNTYQQEFRHSVATAVDFQNVVESKSGHDFDNFFNEWYYGEGYPEFQIKWNYDSDTLYLRQIQKTTSATTPFFHIPVEYKVSFGDAEINVRVHAGVADQLFRIYTGKPVTSITVDPNNWILKNVKSLIRDETLKAPPLVTAAELNIEADFDVYPNPAVSSIRISSRSAEPYSVHLFNSHGASLVTSEKLHGDLEISTAAITPGVYAVRIFTKKGTVTKKVVVR
jgi:aminopeptidase N